MRARDEWFAICQSNLRYSLGSNNTRYQKLLIELNTTVPSGTIGLVKGWMVHPTDDRQTTVKQLYGVLGFSLICTLVIRNEQIKFLLLTSNQWK